jgi:hypothetical protein
MTIAELKLELDRDVPHLSQTEMKNLIERVKTSDFPKIRRMRNRLILESLLIAAATISIAVFSGMAFGSIFIVVIFAMFAMFSIATEITGFVYYWQVPYADSLKDSLGQYNKKIHRITTMMKTVNVSSAIVIMVLLIFDSTLFNLITWTPWIGMICVHVMISLITRKWMAREKSTRKVLKELED